MSWASQVLCQERGLYYLRFHPHEGRAAYFYLCVPPEREKAFQHALKEEQRFDLADFGDVVTSGFGEEAPEHVKDWVQQWHRDTAGA